MGFTYWIAKITKTKRIIPFTPQQRTPAEWPAFFVFISNRKPGYPGKIARCEEIAAKLEKPKEATGMDNRTNNDFLASMRHELRPP